MAAGDRALLDDVTWRLGPGDRVGMVGANGAGKTTLLRLLAGSCRCRRRPVRTTGQRHRADRAARLPDPGARRRSIRTCGCSRRSSEIARLGA